MSWSEIKKSVNSDLDTPLNSLITTNTNTLSSAISNAEDNIITSFETASDLITNANFHTGTFSSTGTILSISGAGALYDFYCVGAPSSSSGSTTSTQHIMNITIDDTTTIIRTLKSNSHYGTRFFGMLQSKDLIYDGYSGTYSYGGYATASSPTVVQATYGTTNSMGTSSSYEGGIYALLAKGIIKFNSSLVLTVTGYESYLIAYYGGCYSYYLAS